MFLLEILVQFVRNFASFFLLFRFLVVFSVDLCERFLRLRILEFEIARGKERVRIDSTSPFDIIEVVLCEIESRVS